MKLCTGCKIEKPNEAFWPDKRRVLGLMARCKICQRTKQREYRKRHPDLDTRRYQANAESERERHLVRKYGVSLAHYAEMLKAQGGACAICRRTQERAFDVDHDHATGRVRGLLCTNCNRMIGHAADDAARLRAAAEYLDAPSSRKSRRNS